MKIADRTPFRNEAGVVDIMGRLQGSLKYGLSWYARLQAQDAVIAVMDKTLGANYILLRNVTLPDTDIDLPLVLVGPPGVFLINVIHERGVYRARDDEWGTIANAKFVPAGINQLQRAIKLGKVLQVYLERAGFKGQVTVDPILMAADPGMHIESVRPAARIVMSDALERFAISMSQAGAVLNADMIAKIAKTILIGPESKTEAPVATSASETLVSTPRQPDPNATISGDSLGFSFDDNNTESDYQPAAAEGSSDQTMVSAAPVDNSTPFEHDLRNAVFIDDPEDNSSGSGFEPAKDADATLVGAGGLPGAENPEPARTAPATKRGFLGMTRNQLLILGAILVCWICGMAAFGLYIFLTPNG